MTDPAVRSIPFTDADGSEKTLDDLGADVVLVVNVASRCGFTSQYAQLEALYTTLHERGLDILDFPCDQFGHQAPGTNEEIARFCTSRFGVTFPQFKKVDVNGSQAHPLFVQLKKRAPGLLGSQGIKWNFTKFLISGDGKRIKRYAPTTKPEALKSDIEALLR